MKGIFISSSICDIIPFVGTYILCNCKPYSSTFGTERRRIMINKQQEDFLSWLLSQKRDINNTISISNSITTYPKNYTEKDIIQMLNELENYELISIKWLGNNHRNLDAYITITLSKDALNYFDNKKRSKVINRRDWIKTYVSVFALIISIISMIISLLSLLLKVS